MTEPREEHLEEENAGNEAMGGDAIEDPAGPTGQPEPEQEPEPEPEPTEEERLLAERDAFEAKWLRVVAELDNVRKRSRREVGDARRFAQADVLRRFLEVLDNFDRALQSTGAGDDTADPDGFREGVQLIFQNFRSVLKDLGVEPIVALGAEFDPAVHEAVATIPDENAESGSVVEVIAEGFMFGDQVLRPARVVIAS